MEHALHRGEIARLGQELETHGRLTLPLGASILVPRLDLGVAERETRSELHAVLHAQILLTLEALLEAVELMIGEGGASLAWLLGLGREAVRVRVRARVVSF